jgi:hypothetical protein
MDRVASAHVPPFGHRLTAVRGACLALVVVVALSAACESVPVAKLNPLSVPSSEPVAAPSPSPSPSAAPTTSPVKAPVTPVAARPLSCPGLKFVSLNYALTSARTVDVTWYAKGGCAPFTGYIEVSTYFGRTLLHVHTLAGQMQTPVGTCPTGNVNQIYGYLFLQDAARHYFNGNGNVVRFTC